MIKQYLRDLINEHKPIDESNDDTMQNTKNMQNTHYIHQK